MISRRFYHHSINLMRLLLLLHLLLIPLTSITGYSVLLDLNTRVSPSDAYIGTYYFWWTNLTYLPLFFFTVVLLFLLTNNFPSYLVTLTLLVLAYTVYPLELVDYLALNCHYGTSTYGGYGLNTLLTNTMNRYHPFIFYASVSLLGLSILYVYALRGSSTPFNHLTHISAGLKMSWWALLINLSALWMGSWWALQEGTWGGWWNW